MKKVKPKHVVLLAWKCSITSIRDSMTKKVCDKMIYTPADFLLLALSPIAPHISENLYKNIQKRY